MKFVSIVSLIISLCFFTGILSAEVVTSALWADMNLKVCSSGIRGNACDPALERRPGGPNKQFEAAPGDVRVRTDYPSYVESRLATNFVLPRGFYNNLSAVVVIKISRNGTVGRDRFEKRSGNPDFDNSVMQAINAATPFSPPPRELTDVGIRVTFYP